MSASQEHQNSVLDGFIERKKNAALSNSALAREAGLSLNTVKAYIRGDQVRDTTIQKLHEALNSYIARQATKLQHSTDVTRLYPTKKSSKALLRQAAELHEQFVQTIKAAMISARNENNSLDAGTFDRIELSIASGTGLVDKASKMAKSANYDQEG